MKSTQPTHEKLSFLRKSLNITQKEMAQKLSMDRSLYSKYERGIRQISNKQLEQFCQFFQLTVSQFNTCDGLDILYYFGVKKGNLLTSSSLNSTQLNSTQLNSTQLNSTQLNKNYKLIFVFIKSVEFYLYKFSL